jgi:hypothetical protein
MSQNAAVLAAKYFFVDLFGGILAFPAWWYTIGLSRVATGAVNSVRNQFANLGIEVWVKNLFNPMYGATDLAGKLISFALRLIMIVARSVGLVLWTVLVTVVVVVYLSSLPVAVLGVLYHLTGGLF